MVKTRRSVQSGDEAYLDFFFSKRGDDSVPLAIIEPEGHSAIGADVPGRGNQFNLHADRAAHLFRLYRVARRVKSHNGSFYAFHGFILSLKTPRQHNTMKTNPPLGFGSECSKRMKRRTQALFTVNWTLGSRKKGGAPKLALGGLKQFAAMKIAPFRRLYLRIRDELSRCIAQPDIFDSLNTGGN